MSRLFGKAIQAGYLVEALEPAMQYWTETLGIGPFLVMPPASFLSLTHRGAEAVDRNVIAAVALAQSGDIQIELIVPGPAPSTYHDFLQSGGRGVHHIGFASHDFDAQRVAGLAAGLSIAMEGRSARTRFSYLEGPAAAPGPIVELIEMSPVITDVFERVRTAAAGWAGEDPIRAL